MESKQRTPLALAIEEIKDQIKKSASEKIRGGDYRIGLTKAINILESLKPKEREMLESFASDYYISPIVGPSNLFNECLTQE